MHVVVKVEQAADEVDDGGGFGIARRRLEGADGGMHDFVDDAAGQGFDGELLVCRHGAEATANAINFSLTNGLEMILEADDRWNDIQSL